IAHQSFTELLDAENVLQQFGLEEAVPEPDKEDVDAAIRRATNAGTESSTDPAAGAAAAGSGTEQAGTWPAPGNSTEAGDSTDPGEGGTAGDGSQSAMVPLGETGSAGTPGVGVREIIDPGRDGREETQWELVSI